MDESPVESTRRPVTTYCFEGFVFDPTGGVISRPHGPQMRLRPQSADVLRYFLHRAQRVVSRDELLEAIWPNVEVTEQSITQCVSDIRRALGANGSALLRTLPKRGYIFATDVRHDTSAMTAIAESPPVGEPAGLSQAQRRQVTMLYCATTHQTTTDPETLRDALAAWHRLLAEIGERYGASLIQYPGSGAALCFGWPTAHEHDAEHAVRAALHLVRTFGRTRIGIATGMVVTGDATGTVDPYAPTIAGAPPTRAARLSDVAEPGTINIDTVTRRLTGALFEHSEGGHVAVDGLYEPVIRLLRESPFESRYEALRGRQHAAIIGREEELELLLRRWRRAVSGEGQVVLISGEPGIGKSRLVAALQESVAQGDVDHERLEWFCAPHLAESALRPVINRLELAAEFFPDDAPQARWERLAALLTPADPTPDEVALLAELLGIRLPRVSPVEDMLPRQKRAATLAALARHMKALCQQRPVLAVVEDAHWIDPTTRELLDLLVAEAPHLRLLLVVTHRPEFDVRAWSGLAHLTELHLARLNRRSNAALIRQVAGEQYLSPSMLEQIITRTDGVPLFVEELTKAVLEAGSAMPMVAVPATLHASLLARLDRLAAVRGVAQAGAVIGREFSYELLASVSELPEASLQVALVQLVQVELVHVRGEPPDAMYTFKHALVRDAAYGSLLKSRRAKLHASVVQALEAKAVAGEGVPPEVLAQHCALACFAERAVNYFERAGQLATLRSALMEARTLYTSALDQLALCPEDHERDKRELELLTSLGAVLVSVSGYASVEMGRTYARAQDLWDRLGRPSEFLRVPCGQWIYHCDAGHLDLAERIAIDLRVLSEERAYSAGQVLAHFCLFGVAMVRGHIALARSHFDKLLHYNKSVVEADLAGQIGFSPRTMAHAWVALTTHWGGYPDTALALSGAALAQARGSGHLPDLAASLAMRVRLLIGMECDSDTETVNNELLQLMEEYGYPFWAAQAVIYDAWLRTRRGSLDGAAQSIRRGRLDFQDSGGVIWDPFHAALESDVLQAVGDDEQAARCLDEALSMAQQTGEAWYVPEILRRRSIFHRQNGEIGEAEAMLRQAIAASENSEMMQWVLRSGTELADLLHSQGRNAEAKKLLVPTVTWFTEGFEMPDLQRATALLEKLNDRVVRR